MGCKETQRDLTVVVPEFAYMTESEYPLLIIVLCVSARFQLLLIQGVRSSHFLFANRVSLCTTDINERGIRTNEWLIAPEPARVVITQAVTGRQTGQNSRRQGGVAAPRRRWMAWRRAYVPCPAPEKNAQLSISVSLTTFRPGTERLELQICGVDRRL